MNVHGEVFEYVVGALCARSLLAFGLFEEQLDAELELAVEPAQLLLHHDDDLVVVLHPQSRIFETVEGVPERPHFYFLHGHLELLNRQLVSFFFEDVDPGGQEDVREAVSQEVGEVALVIFDPVLGHL